MQNEPNFQKVKLNVNKALTKDYEKKTLGERGKNEPKTNPNKANSKKAKMNVTSIITKAYENKTPIRAPKKQSQISKRQKPIQTSLPQRIMKNTVFSGPKKQTQFKPNQIQPVVSLPALPALSAVEGSAVERVEPISKAKKSVSINMPDTLAFTIVSGVFIKAKKEWK